MLSTSSSRAGTRVRKVAAGVAAGSAVLALAGAADVGIAAGKTHRARRRHGYVTGVAKTECGKALRTFKVDALGYTGLEPNEYPSGLPPLGSAKGHHGHYALRTRDPLSHKPVNALVRAVDATAPLHYEGKKYVVPLYPTDGKRTLKRHSARGIVRNFVLRTHGTRPGERKAAKDKTIPLGGPNEGVFYGAKVLMFLRLGDVPGQTLTVHFAPATRKLADGCRAKPFNRSITLAQFQGGETFVFQDIPLGYYTLSATLHGPTTQTVLLALDGQATTTPSVPFRPVPTHDFGDGSESVTVWASLTSSPYGE